MTCARWSVLNLFILTIMLEGKKAVNHQNDWLIPSERWLESNTWKDQSEIPIMLFKIPSVRAPEKAVIGEIEKLNERLRLRLHTPSRWRGSLRRVQFARVVQGSNSIEGYNASLEDTVAIDLGEPPLDANEETRLAIKGYADAMTYVLQLHKEPNFHFGEQLFKSLHFMMLSHDLKKNPGLWRPGAIWVEREATGEIVYNGPDIELVPGLMRDLVQMLEFNTYHYPIVRAAMAHLNLVMIHPFSDGNGRMGRCVQSLVLARNGVLSPVFCSIEEYLGQNTPAYYDILEQVGRGKWSPEADARPWVRFVLTAHLRQATTTLRRAQEVERQWMELDRLVTGRRLNPRSTVALYEAMIGFRVRNATYRAIVSSEENEEITEQAATRDLKQLQDASLLVPHGVGRGRYYTAADELKEIRRRIVAGRDPRDDSDPFVGV
jgi:Fic family protein